MLAKKHRMPKALARDVFMRGSTVSSAHLLVKTLPAPVSPTGALTAVPATLFAVSISKKVAPTAVARNRTRRRIYSVIRDLLPRIKPGVFVGISVKKGGESLAHITLAKELETVLLKLRVI